MKIGQYKVLILGAWLLCNWIYAQVDDKKEVTKLLKKGSEYFEYGDYNAVIGVYSKLEKNADLPEKYYFQYGVSLLHASYDRRKALDFLRISEEKGNKMALFMQGWGHHLLNEFDRSLDLYTKFKSSVDTNSKEFKKIDLNKYIENSFTAREMIRNPVSVEINNVGDQVNSPFPDYVPVITADDQEIFFTSRRENSTGGKKDQNDLYYEDIFHAQKDTTGKWKRPKLLHENLNSHAHDAVAGLSSDGHTLILYRSHPETGAGDLYISYLRGDDWTEPVKLNDEISPAQSWEPSASITANEDAIYFSSDRKGGYGGRDIYMAKRMPNGGYSGVVNLGPGINTAYDEDAPYIQADGNTLYFCSTGHKNMGGFDIFKSERDETGNWKPAENMGYPVNTTDDDIYFVISADGQHGYFSSVREDSYGEKDIYHVKFADKEKPLAVLKGRVTDSKDKPISSMIYVNKTGSKKLFGVFNSNALTGKYLFVLYPGFSYDVVYYADGYIPDTIYVDAKELNSFNQVTRDARLKRMKYDKDERPRYEKDEHAFHSTMSRIVLTPKRDTRSRRDTAALRKAKQDSLFRRHELSMLIDTSGKVQYIKEKEQSGAEIVKNEKEAKPQPINISATASLSGKAPPSVNDCFINPTDSLEVMIFNYGYKLSELKPEQLQVLDTIILKQRSRIKAIKINTHTDSKGSDTYNMSLSQERARKMADYFKKIGIPANKLSACFYGASKPLFANNNPDGSPNDANMFKNRRAEIQIILQP